jgi:hypothetical protein
MMAVATRGPVIETPPVTAPEPESLLGRLRAFRARHEREESLVFFAGGFLFDAAVLKRIDEPAMLLQQGSYLFVIGSLLSFAQYYRHKGLEPPRLLRKIWRFLDHLIHFMMGTLLNGYSIFYFHSASGLTAIGVLVVVAGFLAVNEMPRFHRYGAVVLYAIYSVCLTSYFAYLLPVLLGHISRWMFYAAVLLALVPLAVQGGLLWRWTHSRLLVLKQALAPALAVQLLFVLAYALRLAPPVPLAVKEIGIYHDVKKEPGGRRLFFERPAWQFWRKGDQKFLERPGDRVYCFARVFAPRHFSDRIDAVWFHDDPKHGWRQVYKLPLSVSASSDRGFATEAYLTNPAEGAWRVELQTADGYTVGQLGFEVELDPSTEPRAFFEEFSPAVAASKG